MKIIKKSLFLLMLSISLIGIGWYSNDWYEHNSGKFKDRLIKLKGYEFISPLIDVELPEGYDVRRQPIPFKSKVASYVNHLLDTGQVKDISVYFRDLSDGPWFGINENIKYNPASMMKVPVMVVWLKRAEKDPSVLKRKFTFDEKKYPASFRGYESGNMIKTGETYTVEDLIRYMMNYSDNRALWLLHTSVSREEYDSILYGMDVISEQVDGNPSVTIVSYSGFLRILYNASYLNKEMSERALKIMSFQGFPNGIAAGIPEGTKLASKFGLFNDPNLQGIIQLHEFGIVYHPKGAYILGILTRGKDINKQTEIIRTISEIVYKSVNKQTGY